MKKKRRYIHLIQQECYYIFYNMYRHTLIEEEEDNIFMLHYTSLLIISLEKMTKYRCSIL